MAFDFNFGRRNNVNNSNSSNDFRAEDFKNACVKASMEERTNMKMSWAKRSFGINPGDPIMMAKVNKIANQWGITLID